MCGIAGFIDTEGVLSHSDVESHVSRMLGQLKHRGPDGEGVWRDELSGVALGHRRLSIIDLSSAGDQPMIARSGRYAIVYNGEIYNFEKLRNDLPNVPWRGDSDTEVFLECIDCWGLQRTLERVVGMFALAVWDRESHELVLARDRVGEKPLYFGHSGGLFVFASELNAIVASPNFDATLDRGAIALLMRFSHIPAPYSIYQGISKLLPGTYAVYSPKKQSIVEHCYWSFEDVVRQGYADPFHGSDNEAIDEVERLLKRSIQGQMVSDVPLGAFLSGGIDSSLTVATMSELSPQPVKTFTIGFDDEKFDEAGFAKTIANYLKTDHTELYVTAKDAIEVIPQLPTVYDEPFADSSQLPTFLLCRLTERRVTVALSGDGGDELFGGYDRYDFTERVWGSVRRVPASARRHLRGALRAVPDGLANAIGRTLPLPEFGRPGPFSHKLRRMAELVANDSLQSLYRDVISYWNAPEDLVVGAQEPRTAIQQIPSCQFGDQRSLMMYLDSISYLPNDILTKVDRASMAVSLETRIPLLDHRLIEFAWRLPPKMKVRGDVNKWVLRQVLSRRVPEELFDRPKRGFGVPVGEWLRGPLREWAEELLSEQRLSDEGVFEPRLVRKKWDEHLAGTRNWQPEIWSMLMFQAWKENCTI